MAVNVGLEATEMWFHRNLRITWREHVINEEVLKKNVNKKRISMHKIRERERDS